MSTARMRGCAKICYIPQRYILGMMGALAVVNAYTTRVSLNIAITQMIEPHNASEVNDDSCPYEEGEDTTVVVEEDLYQWTELEQGLVLGSFFIGYILSHMPGGILSDMFGARHVLGAGMAIAIVFTLLTPLCVVLSDGSWIVLVVLRVIEGIGQGVLYPALTTLLAKWIPQKERGAIGTIVYTGSNFGTIISNFGSGYIMSATKCWQAVFYLWGLVGVVWLTFWYILCFSSPDVHPCISDKELEFLEKEIGFSKRAKKKIPWGPIFRSGPNWALIIAQIGHDWGLFMVVNDLPKYMNDVLKYNIKKNALWTSVPYVFMCITSIASGFICDIMINRGCISVTWARKLFTTLASAGPAVFLMAAAYSGCDKLLASWMFTIAMAFMGVFYCGLKVNSIDLAPNYAGTIMAINNGIGALTGFLGPFVVGFLTPNHTLQEWQIAFWITFVIFHVTNIVYLIWGSGETQPWNDYDQGGESKPTT